jgi:hypothetical protein
MRSPETQLKLLMLPVAPEYHGSGPLHDMLAAARKVVPIFI